MFCLSFAKFNVKNLQNTANAVTSSRAGSLPSPPSKEGGGQIEIAAANCARTVGSVVFLNAGNTQITANSSCYSGVR